MTVKPALVVTPFFPDDSSGQGLRTTGIVRALLHHGPVDLLYVPFGGSGAVAPTLDGHDALTLHEARPSRGVRRGLSYARARALGVPDMFARGVSPELRRKAEQLGLEPGRGRVVADGPVAAAALLSLAGRRRCIYNAHNLESDLRRQIGGASQRTLKSFERGVLQAFAESWMVSEADLQAAHWLAPDARMRLVPNVVDVAAIAPVGPRDGLVDVLFVGSFHYTPNRNALRFLVEEVFPAIWRGHPEVTLTVAGRGATPEVLGLGAADLDPRIRLRGFVEDLRPLYEAAGCAVVPLLEGGGSPLKFVEALAHGLPVVATELAARGLEAEGGVHYISATASRPDMAIAIVEALKAPGAERLAAAGRELAERRYSIEALAGLLAPGNPPDVAP